MPPRVDAVLTNPFATEQGRSAQVIKWTLPAGSTKSFPCFAQMFYLKELYRSTSGEAADDIQVRTNLGAENPFNVGTGEGFGTLFEQIEIRNPNDTAVYFEIYLGFSNVVGFIDNRLNIVRSRPESIQPVIEAEVEIVAWPGDPAGTYEIPAGDYVEFAPVLTGNRMRQKGIEISNADPNSPLLVTDTADVPFKNIRPNTTQLAMTSGTVRVRNTTGAAIVAYVGQMYWLRPAP